MLIKLKKQLGNYLNTKLIKKLTLFSFILIPVERPEFFLDLQYKDLPKNKVTINKEVRIEVQNSASPLFVKIPEIQAWTSIEVSGNIKVKKTLKEEKKDAYFQLGIIYEGDTTLGFFSLIFAPEWIKTLLNLAPNGYGLDSIDFHAFYGKENFKGGPEKISGVKFNTIPVTRLKKDGSFTAIIKPREKKILALWLRSDADDERGEFVVNISKLAVIE